MNDQYMMNQRFNKRLHNNKCMVMDTYYYRHTNTTYELLAEIEYFDNNVIYRYNISLGIGTNPGTIKKNMVYDLHKYRSFKCYTLHDRMWINKPNSGFDQLIGSLILIAMISVLINVFV